MMSIHIRAIIFLVLVSIALPMASFGPDVANAQQSKDWHTPSVRTWKKQWPNTDFKNRVVSLKEIKWGGLPKDGIPSIDRPRFMLAQDADHLADREPVIGVIIDGEARAYPLQILVWHEIVNDTLAGVPIAVTYCPLCNTALVFDRRLDGRVLDFGVTGNLRKSDLVMYDRQTESWWQQFTGEGLVGELSGKQLTILSSRLESFALFRRRAPNGKVLIPSRFAQKSYGMTPYSGYDQDRKPMLYRGKMPKGIAPLARIVRIGDEAWSLDLVRGRKRIELEDSTQIEWQPGQASAMSEMEIAKGMEVGNVIVTRLQDGQRVDVPYSVDFAFAFTAFFPDGTIHTEE